MVTKNVEQPEQRTPLSRERILQAALAYVDEHGLSALSMHKLGAQLGVKAMSLYNHVDDKDDVLDGIVEALWVEVEAAAHPQPDWRAGYRRLAQGLRETMQRHPNAAPLITVRQVMPAPALRTIRAHVNTAIDHGETPDDAYALLRTITSYALGVGLAYQTWGLGQPGCAPSVDDLLRADVPTDLADTAHIFCGQSDPDTQFELGLDLMLRNRD